MNTKRILVLVLTLVMLVSAFMPTLSVFAAAGHDHDDESKETLNYVSLGDSMTNGIGMDGYDTTDNPGTDNDGRNGYLETAPDAYPAQFAEWLEAFTGKEVDLTQLATSAMRVEDLYYILTRGTENEIEPDFWTARELLTNPDRWGNPSLDRGVENLDKHAPTSDEVAGVYQEAIKNADVISLATGNGNFGVFLMGRIMNLVGFGDSKGEELALDYEHYGHYTVENAIALVGANEELTNIVLDAYNDALEYLAEMNFPMDLVERVAGLLSYVTASYVIYTIKTIDLIVEMNPDATIIMVPLVNNGNGFVVDFTMNDKTNRIDMGVILGGLYEPLNTFLAAYPTVQQAHGLFPEATFLYAELPVVDGKETQIETFAQAFDKLYTEITYDEEGNVVYPAGRAFCHNRFYAEIIDFIFPIFGLTGSFDDKDVVRYETAKAQGYQKFAEYIQANPHKVEPISYYLGIVDAVLTAMNSEPNVMLDEIELPEGEEFSIFSILGPVVGPLQAELPGKIEDNANAIGESVLYGFIEEAMVPMLTPYFGNDELVTLFEIPEGSDLEKTLYVLQLAANNDPRFEATPELQDMKAQLLNGYSNIEAVTPYIAMLTVIPETLSEGLCGEGLLEALLAMYGRLKLAWGLSAHPSEAGHDTLTDSLIYAYENQWTAQQQTVKNALEAYMNAYQIADDLGAFDTASDAIDTAIDALYLAIDEVNAGTLGVTEELKVRLVKELYAVIDTLRELQNVLDTDSASTVDGLVNAVLALEDDLYTHLNNIYAILEQAAIDVNQLVLAPAFKEALRIFNEEVLPELREGFENFVDAAVEHITEQLNELYVKVMGFANEIHSQILETLVRIQLHVGEKLENALAPIINAYFTAIEVLTGIYGSVEEAVRIAGEILTNIIDTITLVGEKVAETVESVVDAYLALVDKLVATYGSVEEALKAANALLMEIVAKVNGAIVKGLELYNAIVDTILSVYGDLENAFIVASQIFSYVYDFIVDNFAPAKLQQMLSDIVNIFVETYGATKDAYLAATKVLEYFVEMSGSTFEGDYTITADSMYVSLGNAVYGEELAELLNLEDKYFNFYLDEDYLDAVAGADLITIRLDNGEAIEFALTRLYDFSAPLNWDNYLDAEGQAALDAVLADVRASVLANENIDEITVALQTAIDDTLGFTGGIVVTNDFVAYAVSNVIESTLYAYAQFVERFTTTLENVYAAAPNATVVLTGVQNPVYDLDLAGMGLDIDFAQYANAFDFVVAGFNAQLVAAAFVNENTVYVPTNNAQDIYDAINAHCVGHVYDNCLDGECNICGALRPAADAHTYDDCLDPDCNVCGEVRVPGHKFTNYVSNNDAKCGVDGTETAKCDNCDAVDTRVVAGSALAHDWTEATCVALKTCKLCGLTEGELLPHTYGPWNVLREPSHKVQGFREHVCTVCGHLEAEAIPVLTGLPTGAIVAICVGGVVVAGGVGAMVFRTIKKKKAAAQTKA